MDKLDLKSKVIVEENVERIGNLFPNTIIESEKGRSIDFDLLKQELSDILVEGNKEKYQLTWPGKKDSILKANTPTNKTLRPRKEESVDFDNTENLYIEGDNLEVLKILQESYLNKVKVIYIDPPYNTGNDFIYKDDFKKTSEEELLESGQIDEEGNRLVSNNQSNGRYHSDWLSMMYSRLKLARNLLTDDGVIFISIDDNEYENLKKMCDEIFGDINFISNFIRKTSYGEKTAKPNINRHHDYVLVYSKQIEIIQKFDILNGEEKEFDNYSNPDNDPKGDWTKDSYLIKIDKGRYGHARYPIHNPYLNITHYPPVYYNENDRKQWHYVEETFKKMEKEGQVVYFKNKNDFNGEFSFYIKKYKNDIIKMYNNISTLEFANNKYVNSQGTKDLVNVFEDSEFKTSYPKPVKLLEKIIKYSTKNDENSIIMDFFSGSGTTAEAILNLNSNDNGNRKFILIQIPDKVENKEFSNICELGKERIRRAGKKIKEETGADIDYGFRVYKLDSSNMKDVYYNPNKLGQAQLDLFESNIKEDRTSEDLLAQIILDLGFELSLRIEEKDILGNKVYFVEDNSLVACFDEKIDMKVIDEIAKVNPLKLVFKDASFDDNSKINVSERMKRLSPETEIKII